MGVQGYAHSTISVWSASNGPCTTHTLFVFQGPRARAPGDLRYLVDTKELVTVTQETYKVCPELGVLMQKRTRAADTATQQVHIASFTDLRHKRMCLFKLRALFQKHGQLDMGAAICMCVPQQK